MIYSYAIGTLRIVRQLDLISVTLSSNEQDLIDDVEFVANPTSANNRCQAKLDDISAILDISMEELTVMLNEHRDIIKSLYPALETVLIRMNILDEKIDSANQKLDMLTSDLMNQQHKLAHINNDMARSFWDKYFRHCHEVRSSILIEYMALEFDIHLSPMETKAFITLVDKDRSNFITFAEWAAFSRELSGPSSFQDMILKYIEDSREYLLTALGFEDRIPRTAFELLPHDVRIQDNKIGNMFFKDLVS